MLWISQNYYLKQSLSLPLPLSLPPSYRYALICQQCFSHNGMALKEEFEYLGKNRNTLLHLMRRAISIEREQNVSWVFEIVVVFFLSPSFHLQPPQPSVVRIVTSWIRPGRHALRLPSFQSSATRGGCEQNHVPLDQHHVLGQTQRRARPLLEVLKNTDAQTSSKQDQTKPGLLWSELREQWKGFMLKSRAMLKLASPRKDKRWNWFIHSGRSVRHCLTE